MHERFCLCWSLNWSQQRLGGWIGLRSTSLFSIQKRSTNYRFHDIWWCLPIPLCSPFWTQLTRNVAGVSMPCITLVCISIFLICFFVRVLIVLIKVQFEFRCIDILKFHPGGFTAKSQKIFVFFPQAPFARKYHSTFWRVGLLVMSWYPTANFPAIVFFMNPYAFGWQECLSSRLSKLYCLHWMKKNLYLWSWCSVRIIFCRLWTTLLQQLTHHPK